MEPANACSQALPPQARRGSLARRCLPPGRGASGDVRVVGRQDQQGSCSGRNRHALLKRDRGLDFGKRASSPAHALAWPRSSQVGSDAAPLRHYTITLCCVSGGCKASRRRSLGMRQVWRLAESPKSQLQCGRTLPRVGTSTPTQCPAMAAVLLAAAMKQIRAGRHRPSRPVSLAALLSQAPTPSLPALPCQARLLLPRRPLESFVGLRRLQNQRPSVGPLSWTCRQRRRSLHQLTGFQARGRRLRLLPRPSLRRPVNSRFLRQPVRTTLKPN